MGDARVDELLSRMTLQEKLTLIHDSREDPHDYQGQAGYIAGVPRLGIPGLRLADGPPGVLTRHPSQAESATMGVAATFDVSLAEQNGVVIGREARALGIDVALQPYINIDRDLAFRRAYNTYGEDPLLTSEMGAAVIRGIQSQHVMAVAKHFIGYDTTATDVWIDEQTLHQIYLPPFEAAVKADVAAVMCSYNHLNGPYACGNRSLLTGVLRDRFGFKGILISDWGATHSAEFMNDGLDMEMIDGPDSEGKQEPAFLGAEPAAVPPPADPNGETMGDIYGGTIPEEAVVATNDADIGMKVVPKTIAQALADGSVSEATVTRAAGHILYEMNRFGLLDGGSKHDVTPQSVEANARIIEQTGERAAVLLKNVGGDLPLKPADLDSVVLIGPTAGQVDAIGINGERSMGLTGRQVGPLDAFKRISGNSNISFAVADDMTGEPIPSEALSHDGKPGLEYRDQDGMHADCRIDFTVKGGNALPADTKAIWTGTLAVAKSGTYWLYLQVLGTDASLYVDGKRIGVTGTFQGDVHGDILQANQDNVIPTTDGLDNVRHAIDLSAGPHAIKIVISPDTSRMPVQLRLSWYTPDRRNKDYQAAIAAAKRAKTAIVFVWARRVPAFVIPGEQNRLVEDVLTVNPNTIVVLNTSQPVAMPWADRVKAILEMWWPGDEGGWATANLLLGKANPAGRLPVTWGRRLEDYPANDPRFPERSAAGVNNKTVYSEGVNVGYRWFDAMKIAPLFEFGHGLSYSSFVYSGLAVIKSADGGLDVRFELKNTGPQDGDEVPQAYLSAPTDRPPRVAFPVRGLAAFDRIHLAAGEAKSVVLHVPQ
ncbi:MAG TPA: glycoside hydrolase family 3 N-terminal domain-containing protein, partial [Rhizomicrobium sp.]|nr:glycoside hydrolase family 3 N-terminal domain-containing protein [Rhizomicrobium sp.]